MDWKDLAGPLIRLGAPTLGGILGGAPGTAIGRTVGGVLADALGVPAEPAEVKDAMERNPEIVQRVEEQHSEAVLLAAQANQRALLESEDKRGFFHHGWRPMLSWLLLFMWLWNSILIHLVNGVAKAGIPLIPWTELMGFSGLWLAIYGGGHTIKKVWGKE